MNGNLRNRCQITNPNNKNEMLYVPCSFEGTWADAKKAHKKAKKTGYFEWKILRRGQYIQRRQSISLF